MIDSQLRAKKLSYEVHVDPNAVVRADWEKLQQVLLNLLSNAVKFTAPGGRITVDTPGPDQPAGETQADRVSLRVSDTGIGIPRDKLGLVFDPFVQVHRKLTNTIEGSGLGLAIRSSSCRAWVELELADANQGRSGEHLHGRLFRWQPLEELHQSEARERAGSPCSSRAHDAGDPDWRAPALLV